jgi:hypothetical protein
MVKHVPDQAEHRRHRNLHRKRLENDCHLSVVMFIFCLGCRLLMKKWTTHST